MMRGLISACFTFSLSILIVRGVGTFSFFFSGILLAICCSLFQQAPSPSPRWEVLSRFLCIVLLLPLVSRSNVEQSLHKKDTVFLNLNTFCLV
ncbi:hypothetical protein J3R30DRAFT_2379315 [Lentinula aciculospora]|uniref:Uncharacterized protein n=1 Tax=Lentinula aciculospora TaxID=153920 RepID=A0A9W9AEK5_9AGAR|nr:hypothetical protein J3R30DRAFT_2379315 [Lentinula aciculospora]